MEEVVKRLLSKSRIFWKKHALKRMLERGISREDVFFSLKQFTIIERHELERPLPSLLILGYSNKRPLHVMLAVDDEALWVITVYEPTINDWELDFITRRQK